MRVREVGLGVRRGGFGWAWAIDAFACCSPKKNCIADMHAKLQFKIRTRWTENPRLNTPKQHAFESKS